MKLDQLYEQFVRVTDTDTEEGERALDIAGDNDEQCKQIMEGLNSKLRVGFFAGFRVAMQLLQEAVK